MNFARYVFIVFILVCTSLNSSFLNKKDVKRFLDLLNPIATFQPSSISSGHAQYFESKNQLSAIQKSDTKIMLARLRYLRFSYALAGGFRMFFRKEKYMIVPVLINVFYAYEVTQFEKKLDQSLSNKTNNPSKKD